MDVVSDSGLSKRILVLFVFTTLVLIAQGLYNIYSLSGVNNSISRVYDSVNQVSAITSDISLPISELRQLSMSLVMTPNPALRDIIISQILELKIKTQASLNNGIDKNVDDDEATVLFDDIRSAWQEYAAALEVTLEYVGAGVRIAEFINVTLYERAAYEKVTAAIVAYDDHQLELSAEVFRDAQNNAVIAFWAVLITTLVEVVVLKFILGYVLNLVRQYLDVRKQHAQEMKIKDDALEESAQVKKLLEQRLGAEEKLNRLRNYVADIIDSMPSLLIGVDKQLMVTQWNSAAQQATNLGADQVKGLPLLSALPRLSMQVAKIKQVIESGEQLQDNNCPFNHEGVLGYENIAIYPLINSGAEGAVIRIDDVTEQVKMHELMVQSEKMLSVGGLAAGMAHEINNPLAGVLQTSEVMNNRLTRMNMPANISAAEQAGISLAAVQQFMESRGILRMLRDIKSSGERIADIVDNMLSFARKSEAVFSSCALDELIDKTLKLAITDYDLKKHHDFKNINIVKDYALDLPMPQCEEIKIQQVLLNIFRNGAEVMQEAGVVDATFTLRTYFDAGKNMACIEIQDNGAGMNEDTRKRVFEPFFTTKPVGVGTGLGLSVSYFIVTENHGGEMSVESELDQGSTFIIRLPLSRVESVA